MNEPCCDLHRDDGLCCDPDDCGPCCGDCPTCPTLRRQRARLTTRRATIFDLPGGNFIVLDHVIANSVTYRTGEFPGYDRWIVDVISTHGARVVVGRFDPTDLGEAQARSLAAAIRSALVEMEFAL